LLLERRRPINIAGSTAQAGGAVEWIIAIIQQLGKGGNIVALFVGTIGVFKFIERLSSKTALDDFANHLSSADFSIGATRLPK
jgi:hypothetical protein